MLKLVHTNNKYLEEGRQCALKRVCPVFALLQSLGDMTWNASRSGDLS